MESVVLWRQRQTLSAAAYFSVKISGRYIETHHSTAKPMAKLAAKAAISKANFVPDLPIGGDVKMRDKQ
jgi:hypothetical protein